MSPMSCTGAAFRERGKEKETMQKWEVFGKREYKEGILGQVGVGWGTPLILQKTGEEGMTILVTAQVLQRFVIADKEGFIISKGDRKTSTS